jgi:hypothetical protein
MAKANKKDITAEEYIKDLSKEFNVDKLTENDAFRNNFDDNNNESNDSDFYTRFRVLTPNSARMNAAQSMGYRNGLEQYRIPKSYDHRPVCIKKIIHKNFINIIYFSVKRTEKFRITRI